MISNKIVRRLPVFLMVGVFSIISGSCFKMSYSTTGASIPVEAKTFSVQYVENQARNIEPGLSQQVTDQLKEYIQSNSNLILVTGNADIDFEAVITGYDIKPVAIVTGDEASKNRFTITIKVKFTCDVKPGLDFESSFSRYEDYNSDLDFESVSVKVDKTAEILKLLLDDIYKRAFVNW
jgi:CheY-specific phosphatase CheX